MKDVFLEKTLTSLINEFYGKQNHVDWRVVCSEMILLFINRYPVIKQSMVHSELNKTYHIKLNSIPFGCDMKHAFHL
jgi:hypothetical protein